MNDFMLLLNLCTGLFSANKENAFRFNERLDWCLPTSTLKEIKNAIKNPVLYQITHHLSTNVKMGWFNLRYFMTPLLD